MSLIRQILIIAVLATIATGAYFAWEKYGVSFSADDKSKRRGGAPRVEVAKVEYREFDLTVEAVGSTRARRAVDITPLASGRVTDIVFKPGQKIASNAVLVRLDDEIQRADLKEAEASLEEALSAMQRTTSLNRNSAVAVATVESQAAAVATAEAERDRAVRKLSDRTVRAPFSGIIGFARIELGSRVKEGDVITTLDDLSTVEIEFAVPEALYGRVEIGQQVSATASAFPQREFNGTIGSIDSRIDPVTRAVTVRAVVKNPDRLLPAGMFMHVSVVLDPRRALTVPESALQVQASESFVYALVKSEKGESVTRRKVEVGQRSFGFVEILSGLETGQEVVTQGVHRLREGVLVERAGSEGANKPRGKGKQDGTDSKARS